MTGNEANMSIKYAVCVLEAIGNGLTLSNENDREVACAFAIQAIEEKQQYRAIGTIEEFKALKEKKPKKQKSNKVIFSHDSYAYCPHCHHNVKLLWASHCDKCGGELDWKDRKLQAN